MFPLSPLFSILFLNPANQSQVPENYLRAIFGSYLASRFVYEYGNQPSQFSFFDFMSKRMAKLQS